MTLGPDLSVVVITRNGRDMAPAFLEWAIDHLSRQDVEWVIVDRGSTDGTPDAIEARWPAIPVLRLDAVAFATANDVGFSAALGRRVLALSPDVALRRGDFERLLAAMRSPRSSLPRTASGRRRHGGCRWSAATGRAAGRCRRRHCRMPPSSAG